MEQKEPPDKSPMTEIEKVQLRYERRRLSDADRIYNLWEPHVHLRVQERERALIRWIRSCDILSLDDKRVLEIGCGNGSNLLELLRLGFCPQNLVGNELLEDRAALARHRLPAATQVFEGDAAALSLPEASFDVVFQSTVFTSLLDYAFQQRLADKMWALAKPGGGILWYDFIYDNPRNPDVRGIPVRRVRQLFPQGRMTVWRLTLAPPISRSVVNIHPGLYSVLNTLPFLRTHILCWIRK